MRLFLFLLISASLISAQNYAEKIQEYLTDKDTLKIAETLIKWEQEDPENVEMLTNYFQYYVFKATRKKELSEEKKKQLQQIVIDQGKNIELEFDGETYYDSLLLDKAYAKLDKALSIVPDRIDLHITKLRMLEETKDWARLTKGVKEMIMQSAKNKNKWQNEKGDEEFSQKSFLLNVQDYQTAIFNNQRLELLGYILDICDEVLKYYPGHAVSLSNKSVVYMILKDYESAITVLKEAEKNDPNDGVVIQNIAYAYYMLADTTNSVKYYRLLEEHGNENQKAKAKKSLTNLGF